MARIERLQGSDELVSRLEDAIPRRTITEFLEQDVHC